MSELGNFLFKLERTEWSWNVPSEVDKFHCSWKIKMNLNTIENFPISSVAFQLQLYFPTSVRAFQLHFFQFHVKFSISMIFPTKQSNYTNPGGTLWSRNVTIEVGQLLDQSFPTSFRPFQFKLLSYGVLSNAKCFNFFQPHFSTKTFLVWKQVFCKQLVAVSSFNNGSLLK